MQSEIQDEVWEEYTPKQRVCYILCNRTIGEECQNDMGVLCQLYEKEFTTLFIEEDMEEDPEAWEYEDEEDEEEEDEEDYDDCDKEIVIKKTTHRR